jgi:hypothetical protein
MRSRTSVGGAQSHRTRWEAVRTSTHPQPGVLAAEKTGQWITGPEEEALSSRIRAFMCTKFRPSPVRGSGVSYWCQQGPALNPYGSGLRPVRSAWKSRHTHRRAPGRHPDDQCRRAHPQPSRPRLYHHAAAQPRARWDMTGVGSTDSRGVQQC